jgi:hypothetical protein
MAVLHNKVSKPPDEQGLDLFRQKFNRLINRGSGNLPTLSYVFTLQTQKENFINKP